MAQSWNQLCRIGIGGELKVFRPCFWAVWIAHGDTAFTVPLFDQYLKRKMPATVDFQESFPASRAP